MPDGWSNWIVLVATGAATLYGLGFRQVDGQRSWLHLLIGGVALVLFLRVLTVDLLGLW